MWSARGDSGNAGGKEGEGVRKRTNDSILIVEMREFPLHINPSTPKISLVILLTVCHTIAIM